MKEVSAFAYIIWPARDMNFHTYFSEISNKQTNKQKSKFSSDFDSLKFTFLHLAEKITNTSYIPWLYNNCFALLSPWTSSVPEMWCEETFNQVPKRLLKEQLAQQISFCEKQEWGSITDFPLAEWQGVETKHTSSPSWVKGLY